MIQVETKPHTSKTQKKKKNQKFKIILLTEK